MEEDISCTELINNLTRLRNETIDEFLERAMGPKQLGLDILLPVSVTYVLIFATGVLGNVAVCVVIFRTDELKSATNFYLISMALSDLSLLLLGLPNDLCLFWQQYPWPFDISWCKFRALISEMASNTSVLTIVVFSIERYVAICFPLRKGNFFLSDHERIVRVIACVWLVSLVFATPFAAFTTINHINYTNTTCQVADSAFCAMLDSNVPPCLPIYELSGLLFFLLPLLTLMVLYRKMNEALNNSPFWNSRSTKTGKTGTGVSGESRRFNNNNDRNAATTVRMLCIGIDIRVADSAFCAMLDSNVPPCLPIYELSGLLFFLLPLLTLMVLYRKMNEALNNSPFWNSRSTKTGKTGTGVSGESRRFNNNNDRNAATTVRMLFAVVVTFFLCWAPFHLQRLLYIYGQNLKHYLLINEWLYYIAGFSYYVSATINPILYNLMSSRFRRAFRKNICTSLCWADARSSQRQRHYNSTQRGSFTFKRRRNVARRNRPRRGSSRQQSVDLVVELEQPELAAHSHCRQPCLL
ncbi:neuropeptides capa receptor [Nilaparvata lugens]|uniref:neuropeptides capa receptor n=1 Tax=Nilaparvata lugens TaxID=108931 RepID=UPI00193DF30D|nr:neuropeptides capa receptor [Nilaparvata lugens]